ncbi:helix-turn-helix domain-containing protein [Herbaspirillum sp. AP02]|uniref:helix-turn-helix domain-containing protein n=1 Tax=unclassified Herbaspirillum TaxID=2624150 RepID=UPI0015D9F8CF|nr:MULTISPECIES: helix-turn-helix transcriptional regulator [unclassified Herbaspirillum]MBG7621983.1 helix-turn-helix domain-containing protein [Herbaspirillum sp. AP02]NZD69926.1 helix-turn-helix domain-containing protein [Herbaspirillum sp. AP21]
MSPYRASLGQRLKAVRLRLGISQRQLALALDTAPNHICQIERGHCIPGAKLLRGMREQFGIDINCLLSGEENYVATTLLEQEVNKLIRQFQHADVPARAILLQTASFTANASG